MGKRLGRLLLLALVVAAVYWYVRERPTVTGLVNRLTRPLEESRTAVKESERNRVIETAVPQVGTDAEAVPMGALHEKMTYQEVRDLLGRPDRTEEFVKDGRPRVRWIYPRVRRALVFEGGRVVSIAIL